MNRERARYWGEYMRDLADRLELRDWTVTCDRDYAQPPYGATADCIYGRKSVTVAVCAGFDDWPPERQRQTIVHELLHAHTARTSRLLHEARDTIGKYWVGQLDTTIRQDLEYAIDAIACALDKHMPLPPTEQSKKRKKKGGAG